jgi:8-oxo-dGTP pyrophosphatase MutT (NUDIX family)
MTPRAPSLPQIRQALQRHDPRILRPPNVDWRMAAVLVPLLPRPDGVHVLFTERSKELRAHGGQVSFPGGGIEPQDRGPREAALRESFEEVGLRDEHVEVIGQLDDCPTFVSGFVIAPFVGIVDPLAFTAAGRYPWTPSAAEIAALHELPLSEFLVPENRRVEMRERDGIPYELTWYTIGGTIIWGATARILRQLLEWADESVEAK